MNINDKEINTLIMQEIGLEVGPRQRVYDQDTGAAIRINGMDIVAPGCNGGRQAVEFDPYNNRKMMGQLFSHFLEKYAEETDVDCQTFYNVDSGTNGKVQCRLSDNTILTSKPYQRDSLKYMDIIMQLNGDASPDLEKYDVLPDKETVKKPQKRGSKNATAKGKSYT